MFPAIRTLEDALALPVAPPQISDLLRDGARQGRQLRRQFFDRTRGASCAIGAVLIGAEQRGELPRTREIKIDAHFAKLLDARELPHMLTPDQLPDHPEFAAYHKYRIPLSVIQACISLNDACGWTRGEIADWLQSIGY